MTMPFGCPVERGDLQAPWLARGRFGLRWVRGQGTHRFRSWHRLANKSGVSPVPRSTLRSAATEDGQPPQSKTSRRFLLPTHPMLIQVLACLLIGLWSFSVRAAETNPVLNSWFTAQAKVETWSADFVQARAFKALTQPLIATGHVWFAKPNRFRWELGSPPQTIALRGANEMFVIYPQLKRAERYLLAVIQSTPWRDTLALLDAGFPQTQAEAESRYKILSLAETNSVHELTLQPKSSGARKMMRQMKIAFDTKGFQLRATEMEFADGSTMRNDFTNIVTNPKIDDEMFKPKLGSDFKITEPLKK